MGRPYIMPYKGYMLVYIYTKYCNFKKICTEKSYYAPDLYDKVTQVEFSHLAYHEPKPSLTDDYC